MIKKLELKDIEYLAHHLAQKFLTFDEPIPDFGTRLPDKLESCIETPFMTYNGKALYRGLAPKAAILFYLLIKNHPFQNGNKRLAVTTLLIFLERNGKWLYVGTREFYNFAVWVASSPPELKDDTVRAITSFIKKYLRDY